MFERTWRPIKTECNLVLLLELPRRRDSAVRREQDFVHGLLAHESHLQRLSAEGKLLVADSIVALQAVLARQRDEVPVRAVLGAHEIHRGNLLSHRVSFNDSIPTRYDGRRELEVSLVKHLLEAACGRVSLELSVLLSVRGIDAVDILDLQVRPEALFLHVDGAEPRDLVGNADVTKVLVLIFGRGEVVALTVGVALTQVALVEVMEGLRAKNLRVIDREVAHGGPVEAEAGLQAV